MPNAPEEKRKAIMRLKRIGGQAEALIRAIDKGTPCAAILQQVASMRGAVNGLMSEILESHLKETLGPLAESGEQAPIDDVVSLIQTYLK